MKRIVLLLTATAIVLLMAVACGQGQTTTGQGQMTQTTTTTQQQKELTAREQTIMNIFGRLDLANDPYDNLYCWTDGDAFYRPYFFDACLGGQPGAAVGDTIYFCGGTMHEGGWAMTVLLSNDGKMTMADDDWRFNKGDRVEHRVVGDETILTVKDARTGTLKLVYRKFEGRFYDECVNHIYQYVLAGTFKRQTGSNETVKFDRKKSAVSGLMSKGDTPYTLIDDFGDTPASVLRFSDDVVYKAVRTLIGVDLIPILTGPDIELEWQIETDESKPVITLVKTAQGRSDLPPGFFPLASVQVMTLPELRIYAGVPYQLCLQEMRNEIFARHGYIFKSFEWSSYYSNRDWYNPQYSDVNDKLTEIERINIALIQVLEREIE